MKADRERLRVVGLLQRWERATSHAIDVLREDADTCDRIREPKLGEAMRHLADALEVYDRERTRAITNALKGE